MNPYATEMLARDRIARLRDEAETRRLIRRANSNGRQTGRAGLSWLRRTRENPVTA